MQRIVTTYIIVTRATESQMAVTDSRRVTMV
jgi:hypothetical protein